MRKIAPLIRACGAAAAVFVAALLASPAVFAQSVIGNPTQHPQYVAELEPHLLLDFIPDEGWGLGGRATFEVMDPGFVTSINDSIGIGVGIDWLDHKHHHLWLPAVMQWNFWFTPHWSAFGEPGLVLDFHYRRNDKLDIHPVALVGGRFSFNDNIALTLRVGVPSASFGVSFFL